MKKSYYYFLHIIAASTFLQLGCAENGNQVAIFNYTLPEEWSVAEDTQKTPQHRKITLVTPSGDFAEMELLQGDQAFSIDSRDYMTRYIQATLPTEELRENTEFDFGDVSRKGQQGYFMNVTAPGKTQVQFILEFYQFATEHSNLFVVLTTDPGLTQDQQREFDQFLGSIYLSVKST